MVAGEEIVSVRGSKVNPITHGAVCAKVANLYPEFVHGPNRLRHPLKRVGAKGDGRFARISWEEALDIIHSRVSDVIARYGPQALLPLNYAGPHGMLAGDSMSLRFFHKIGASLLSRSPLCGGIRSAAYFGTFGATPGTPLQQVSQAKLIIVWGNNATSCNLHLMRQINAAKRNGAKLVVIDPRRVKVAEQAHLHLPVRPGTDVVLAWAIAVELERRGGLDRRFIEGNVLGFEAFMKAAREYPAERAAEICGIPADDIRTLARWMAFSAPPTPRITRCKRLCESKMLIMFPDLQAITGRNLLTMPLTESTLPPEWPSHKILAIFARNMGLPALIPGTASLPQSITIYPPGRPSESSAPAGN